MNSIAVVLKKPEQLELNQLVLTPAGDADVVVDVEWSGISTGTERLLWSGRMPPFPGMGYPLVPGYESVGRVTARGPDTDLASVTTSSYRVPAVSAKCAACSAVPHPAWWFPAARIVKLDQGFGERGILLALAATAQHAIAGGDHLPDLIVGHGVLGRMIARLTVAAGGDPVVWERNPMRAEGAEGYGVIDPELDDRRNYRCICDVSGDGSLLDTLISRLAPHGEIVLAGFYEDALSFNFPPAFMREARLRIAAQWQESDLVTVRDMAASGQLSLDGLITHRQEAARADAAYRTAFSDPACLKMILDWRSMS
jgi:3-hydroxyethyl bacteriochlorophyllide a dehydrogenase